MRIAINLGRDVLRRRKRHAYVGPWLPTPIDTDDGDSPPSFEPACEGQTLEGRYDLLESVSLAFLQALEALTPTQRAVLLLRDAFDYSAGEVAAVIDTTEGNVRVIHHRARRAIAAYDAQRTAATPATRARTHAILRQFVELLTNGDVAAIERMLAADVKAVTDGGGEFTASRIPVVGAFRVARFFSRLAASRTGRVHVVIRSINGQPAAVFDFPRARGRRAPRIVLSVDIDRTERIANVWVIASSTKLGRVA
jgi:RNA polymerase sigma-70 factor (ECF subfamily)